MNLVVVASRKLYSEEITAAGMGNYHIVGDRDFENTHNFKGLVVTFDKVGSWESNSLYYAQYNVSIENHNSNEVTSWKFSIPVSGQINKDNSWNCSPDSA